MIELGDIVRHQQYEGVYLVVEAGLPNNCVLVLDMTLGGTHTASEGELIKLDATESTAIIKALAIGYLTAQRALPLIS